MYDIKRASQVGRTGNARYILTTCPTCDAQRYTFLRSDSVAEAASNKFCAKCNPRFKGA